MTVMPLVKEADMFGWSMCSGFSCWLELTIGVAPVPGKPDYPGVAKAWNSFGK